MDTYGANVNTRPWNSLTSLVKTKLVPFEGCRHVEIGIPNLISQHVMNPLLVAATSQFLCGSMVHTCTNPAQKNQYAKLSNGDKYQGLAYCSIKMVLLLNEDPIHECLRAQ